MNDIVFISPSNQKLGRFHSFVPRSIPLGLALLSGYIAKHGYTGEIVDEEIVDINYEYLKEKSKTMSTPKIFGISAMTTNSARSYDIARMIKQIDKDAFVVMGGIHPTVMPEEVMRTGFVDFVVRGEGERALLSLVKNIKTGAKDWSGIKDLVFKDTAGEIIYNEVDDKPFDINELPSFPYDMFDNEHYDLGFILTSRGCPFDCIFCSQRAITKRKYRALNNEKTMAELEHLINVLGQKNITFFDDFFTGDKKRVFELCGMIREKGLHKKCSFGVQTRGDSVNRELLVEMKRSGFDGLMFGFETASNHLMQVINKQETVEDNINAIKLAKDIGFTIEATFIYGFPEETYQDRQDALQVAKAIVDRARFNNATPYPGTRLYEIAVSENKIDIEKGWDNFSSAGAVTASIFRNYKVPYCPEGTKPEDLLGEVFLANLLFYLNISSLKNLFNPRQLGSGKWFEVPKQQMLDPLVWFNIALLAINTFMRAVYYFTFSRECRRFCIEGFFVKDKFKELM